jgi:NADH:ubiquinone oxidoreductase subunit 5 (subunit L)/multisubunit Na+/H+ antiporter MnhA subunit
MTFINSTTLAWFLIILTAVNCLLQIARLFFVDLREGKMGDALFKKMRLAANIILIGLAVLAATISVFKQTLDSLEHQIAATRLTALQADLKQSQDQLDALNNRILSASAVLTATLIWVNNANDSHGYSEGTAYNVIFGSSGQKVLAIASHDEKDELTKGIKKLFIDYDISNPSSEVDGTLRDLQKADVLRLNLPGVPDGSTITEGTLVVTLNRNKTFAFDLKSRTVRSQFVDISNLDPLRIAISQMGIHAVLPESK